MGMTPADSSHRLAPRQVELGHAQRQERVQDEEGREDLGNLRQRGERVQPEAVEGGQE